MHQRFMTVAAVVAVGATGLSAGKECRLHSTLHCVFIQYS